MDKEIKEFFEERKDAWLKKKLKKGISPEEEQKIQEECEEKFCLDNWLPDAARRANELFMATHPPKFSHPDIKGKNITSVIFNGVKQDDGFLRTGNGEAWIDIYGNAAALDVYTFLSLKFDDGKTVLEHLEKGNQTAKEQLHISTASFEEIQKGFLCVKQSGEETKTSGLLKQVYFPIEPSSSFSDYHLLSILTPSGLVFELKKRIDDILFSETTKEVRQLKKKEEYSENGFDELLGLTKIKYGGSKTQNISVLNSNNGGIAYLLSSLPPTFKKRDIRLPKKDFFSDSVRIRNFKEVFTGLHKILLVDHNNMKIREGIERRILSIMDQVIEQSWLIRKHQSGWSEGTNYSNLPVYQKIWLDDIRVEEREESEEWLDRVIEEFAYWIVWTCKKITHDKDIGDEKLLYIKKIIKKHEEEFI